MMSKPIKTLSVLMTLVFLMSGCSFSSSNLEFNRASRAEKNKDYPVAIKYYKRVIKRKTNLEQAVIAAQKAARLSVVELEKHNDAIELYNFIIINSKSFEEAKQAQSAIADIYFSKLQNFSKSISSYNKLLSMRLSNDKKIQAKERVAKSYFYLNKFFQSKIEVDDLLSEDLEPNTKFQLLIFKGTILQTLKDYKEAVVVYKKIIEEFPEKALKESVYFNLAMCYEEQNDFVSAIELMQDLKKKYPDPEFVEHKIFRLKQRKSNLPGARGRVR